MMRWIVRAGLLASLAFGCAASAANAAPAPPGLVGSISNGTAVSGAVAVAVSGHYAYSASAWSGQLNVIDVSNPTSPNIVGSTASTSSLTGATNVSVSGSYAFVTSRNRNASTTDNDDGTGNTMTIVDVSNPAVPSVVGTVTDRSSPRSVLFGAEAVAVAGQFAYVASQGDLAGQPSAPSTSTGSFAVIDITSPTGPTVVANIDNSNPSLTGSLADALEHAASVAISGHYAYVTAQYSDRLTVIDISVPTDPVVVSSLHDPTNLMLPNDVVTAGGYAYVVNEISSGPELAVVSLANPTAPVIVTTLSNSALGGAYRARTRGSFLYVAASSTATLAAVDVSNPASPRLAGVVADVNTLAHVTGLDVSSSGRYLIAASPRRLFDPMPVAPPYPGQPGGPSVMGTVSVSDLDPLPIAVTIAPSSKPASATTQTAASFRFTVSDAIATVQCSLDTAPFGPCSSLTTASYGSLAVGSHTFAVEATDATGTTAKDTYSWVVGTAPHQLLAPTVSGIPREGTTLRAGIGAWSGIPGPTFSYQWQRCAASGRRCTAIAGQTQRTHKATVYDVGSRLNVVLEARNPIGSATATTAATGVVTWRSGSVAKATLTKSQTAKPGLGLTVPSVGRGVNLQRFTISLPKGMRFTDRTAASILARVRSSPRGLRFAGSLRRSGLTIRLRKPVGGIRLTFARGSLRLSQPLARQIRFHKAKPTVALRLTLYYGGKPPRRGAVTVRPA